MIIAFVLFLIAIVFVSVMVSITHKSMLDNKIIYTEELKRRNIKADDLK